MKTNPLFSLSFLFSCLVFWMGPVPLFGQAFSGPNWVRHTIDASSRGADGVRLADVNLDGLPDVTTSWEEGGEVHVCLHPGENGSRGPWPHVVVGEVSSPEDAVFTDLDGDGIAEVVSCCEGRNRTIFFHWATGGQQNYLQRKSWLTTPLPASSHLQQWMFCLPGHVDHKNGVDLVAGGKGAGATVGWFESPRNAKRVGDWKWHPVSPVGWLMSLHAIDMDTDGDLDIVLTDRRGLPHNRGRAPSEKNRVKYRGCRWLENPGSYLKQTGSWASHPIGGEQDEVMFMCPVDFDHNGLWDFFVATRGSGILYLQGVPGAPLTWKTIRIPLPPAAGTAKAVQVADINLDRQLDLVVTCENAEQKTGVFWMSIRLNAAGTVGQLVPWNVSGARSGTKYDLVEVLDLDGDGDLDILTCEERDNLGVLWYENPVRQK